MNNKQCYPKILVGEKVFLTERKEGKNFLNSIGQVRWQPETPPSDYKLNYGHTLMCEFYGIADDYHTLMIIFEKLQPYAKNK